MSYLTDKRRFPRVSARFPIRYKELRGNTYLSKGTLTKDLSKGGARFRTDRFMSLACHLFVELDLPHALKSIKTISKVAWIRKLPVGDDYEVGTQFLAMTSQDESKINDCVEKAKK